VEKKATEKKRIRKIPRRCGLKHQTRKGRDGGGGEYETWGEKRKFNARKSVNILRGQGAIEPSGGER